MNDRDSVKNADVVAEEYGSDYVANRLDVKPATLRKYASLVEKNVPGNANRFHSEPNEPRRYRESDVQLFAIAQQLMDNKGIALAEALRQAFTSDKVDERNTSITVDVTKLPDTVSAIVAPLMAQNTTLTDKVDELNKKLDLREEQLDQLSKKLDSITTKLDQQPTKRSFWSRLFGG